MHYLVVNIAYATARRRVTLHKKQTRCKNGKAPPQKESEKGNRGCDGRSRGSAVPGVMKFGQSSPSSLVCRACKRV